MGDKMAALYRSFGVAEYAERLRRESKHEQLRRLDQTLSKFILVKGIKDLSEEARRKLEVENIKDGMDLYRFFDSQIENFQERLEEYGRSFREKYITG